LRGELCSSTPVPPVETHQGREGGGRWVGEWVVVMVGWIVDGGWWMVEGVKNTREVCTEAGGEVGECVCVRWLVHHC